MAYNIADLFALPYFALVKVITPSSSSTYASAPNIGAKPKLGVNSDSIILITFYTLVRVGYLTYSYKFDSSITFNNGSIYLSNI